MCSPTFRAFFSLRLCLALLTDSSTGECDNYKRKNENMKYKESMVGPNIVHTIHSTRWDSLMCNFIELNEVKPTNFFGVWVTSVLQFKMVVGHQPTVHLWI